MRKMMVFGSIAAALILGFVLAGCENSATPNNALTFTDSAAYDIPAGTAGTAITNINVSGGVSGGTAPYTFTATGFPPGISIDPTTGVISGTPSAGREAGTVTITVTDSAGASQSIVINYGAIIGSAPLSFTHNAGYDIPPSTADTAIASIDVSGGVSGGTYPYTFEATGLPAGISISTAGVISGTPTTATATAAGTATITVTDSATPSASESIDINYGAIAAALAFEDSDSYDIPENTEGTEITNINVSGGVSDGTAPYTFEATGLPPGISISTAGVISGTPTTPAVAGTATITVTDSANASQSITIDYGVIGGTGADLSFTHNAGYDIPASTAGTPITNIDVSGGVSGGTFPYTFEAPDLPAGISISTAGVISGTPTQAAVAGTATITVTDSADASESIDINYGAIAAGLAFEDSDSYDIPASTVGTAITNIDVSVGVSGGTAPYTFAAVGLPAGISIAPATGVISGTPAAVAAAGTAKITVTDSATPKASKKSIDINYGAVTLELAFTDSSSYDIPASTVGTAITTINVSGGVSDGTAPYTFKATGLPVGISIAPDTGVISGTPTVVAAAGTATITVTDSVNASKSIPITYGAVAPKAPGDKTVAQLITEGSALLVDGSYDSAVESYESAYAKNSNDPAAIVYSSLARLASIAKDQKVQDLLKNRFGVSSYPGTIDGLLSTDWLSEYEDEEFVPYYFSYDTEYYWVNWHGEYPKTNGFFSSSGGSYVFASQSGSVVDDTDYKANGPGYYRQEFLGSTYEWNNAAPRYDYSRPLDTYYDSDLNMYVDWQDDPEGERVAGYYYYNGGALTFISSDRKYRIESYYDYEFNVYLEWFEAGRVVNGETIKKTGYHYREYKYKLFFVTNTPRYEVRGTSLFPLFEVPQWVEENGAYNDSLTSGDIPSIATMQLLLFANLLDKNTNGLNTLLDQTLEAVFGANFDAVADRVAKLTYDQSVSLNQAIIEGFGLTEIFGGDVVITKVEMDLLVASLRIVKAALEWINAYDWNTDLNFLKVNWLNSSYDTLLANIRKTTSLPLKNNFLKARSNSNDQMNKSKRDFITAIDAAIDAYDHINDENLIPPGVKDEIAKRQWIKVGLTALRNAINSGETFWIPKEPAETGWNYSKETASIGIHLGHLFIPGYVSLDKLIENTNGIPKFYGFPQTGDPVAVSAKENIKNYDVLGFKVITGPLYGTNGVLVKIDGVDVSAEEYVGFPADIAEALWDAYHK